MFTGIIEDIGTLKQIEREGSNVHFTFYAPFADELKIDQSLAHNGVCLTVVGIQREKKTYQVTAIKETLDRTNLGLLKVNDHVNLERCTQIGARLDGHIVQGHVDQTGVCTSLKNENGSWKYTFSYTGEEHITVSKGSITINGVSLTVVDSSNNSFSVAIIPYTYEHTNFNSLNDGSVVNLEFDIIGKYVAKLMQSQLDKN
jgi:riboflavin synthase